MAENALALLQHLSSSASPLPSLTEGYSRPTTVYFSHLGHFFVYSFTTAKILYGLLLVASLILVKLTFTDPGPALKKRKSVWAEQVKGSAFIFAGLAGAWITPNIVAAIMRYMGKGMSWFSKELSPLALYGPPSVLGMPLLHLHWNYLIPIIAGALTSQLILGRIQEHTLLTSILLTQAFTAFVIQMFNIGSAAMFFVCALPLFFTLILNRFVAKEGQVSLWTYAFGQLTPLLTSTILFLSVSEVFVPLVCSPTRLAKFSACCLN